MEEAASTPPEYSELYPDRFINGMVNTPLETVLATELPVIVPEKALVMMLTLPVPPTAEPVMPSATSVKNFSIPVRCSIEAKIMNRKMKVAEIPNGVPNTPSVPT